MTRTRLVAMTIIVLGFAAGAYAQTDDAYAAFRAPRQAVRVDLLDPVTRVAILAARVNRNGIAAPATTPDRVAYFTAPDVQAPVAQPARTIADRRPSGPSGFLATMQGISQGLQVSHEALDVYEHAIKANALKNYYDER